MWSHRYLNSMSMASKHVLDSVCLKKQTEANDKSKKFCFIFHTHKLCLGIQRVQSQSFYITIFYSETGKLKAQQKIICNQVLEYVAR